jgi:hypothetical protein
MTPNRDPFQLTLPLTLQPKDEAFVTGLKAGFERGAKSREHRFYTPKLTDFELNVALKKFQHLPN